MFCISSREYPSFPIDSSLDLGLYQITESVPFSHSSNLLQALQSALEQDYSERYKVTEDNLTFLRREIESIGLSIIVPKIGALPYIITIQIPKYKSSLEFGDIMASFGFKLHYESSYLIERNWLQISIIGRQEEEIRQMLDTFKEVLASE